MQLVVYTGHRLKACSWGIDIIVGDSFSVRIKSVEGTNMLQN